jgi:hypothetical protein
MGLGLTTSDSIIHADLHKPNNKLVSVELEHFWCTDKPRTNTNSQDSPWLELGGSHHLPPYSILYAWPWGQHQNVILSPDSQVGLPKFPKLGLPQLWRPIILHQNSDWSEVWSKVVVLVESFPTICRTPLACKEVKVIPDF